MLVELYIFVMIIAFVFFIIAYFSIGQNNSELLWIVCAVLFGIMAMSSSVVQSLEPFYNATGNYYYISSYNHVDLTLIWVNVAFMSLSIIFGYMDIMSKFGKGADDAIDK